MAKEFESLNIKQQLKRLERENRQMAKGKSGEDKAFLDGKALAYSISEYLVRKKLG